MNIGPMERESENLERRIDVLSEEGGKQHSAKGPSLGARTLVSRHIKLSCRGSAGLQPQSRAPGQLPVSLLFTSLFLFSSRVRTFSYTSKNKKSGMIQILFFYSLCLHFASLPQLLNSSFVPHTVLGSENATIMRQSCPHTPLAG